MMENQYRNVKGFEVSKPATTTVDLLNAHLIEGRGNIFEARSVLANSGSSESRNF